LFSLECCRNNRKKSKCSYFFFENYHQCCISNAHRKSNHLESSKPSYDFSLLISPSHQLSTAPIHLLQKEPFKQQREWICHCSLYTGVHSSPGNMIKCRKGSRTSSKVDAWVTISRLFLSMSSTSSDDGVGLSSMRSPVSVLGHYDQLQHHSGRTLVLCEQTILEEVGFRIHTIHTTHTQQSHNKFESCFWQILWTSSSQDSHKTIHTIYMNHSRNLHSPPIHPPFPIPVT
jgi:hypothetical protein